MELEIVDDDDVGYKLWDGLVAYGPSTDIQAKKLITQLLCRNIQENSLSAKLVIGVFLFFLSEDFFSHKLKIYSL